MNDIGENAGVLHHEPAPTDTRTWVSKTDLTRYLRCPLAFYLLDRGQVAFEDTVNEQEAHLIKEGVAFQARIEASSHLSSSNKTTF
jgi:hypothetical protein